MLCVCTQEKELQATWMLYIDELVAAVRLAADDARPMAGMMFVCSTRVVDDHAHTSIDVTGKVHGLSRFAASCVRRSAALYGGTLLLVLS